MQVDDQVASRMAGFHSQGMQLAGSIADDSTFVGKNTSSLAPAAGGGRPTATTPSKEGTFLVTSHGATFGGDGTAGNSATVCSPSSTSSPQGAKFYRSQVTEEEMRLATDGTTGATASPSSTTRPSTRHDARIPWAAEGKAGLPILNMLQGDELVHSDLNAIIAGPNADRELPRQHLPAGERRQGAIPACPTGSSPSASSPSSSTTRWRWPTPSRLVRTDRMAWPTRSPTPCTRVGDVFMVNYGSGGVGSEVIANRLGVGPMHDCLDCVYEEFFLTSSAVGDPAMLVDIPANFGLEACAPSGAELPGAAGPEGHHAPTTRTTPPTCTTATSATS